MRDLYEIKQSNSDYKASLIIGILMFIVGCAMLMCGDWREIFFGFFFVIGSGVLLVFSIKRKREFEKVLKSYLNKKLKEYFRSKNAVLRFVLKRKKNITVSYIIYVNGYVDKTDFEMFMDKFKEETGVKMEYRLFRKPTSTI